MDLVPSRRALTSPRIKSTAAGSAVRRVDSQPSGSDQTLLAAGACHSITRAWFDGQALRARARGPRLRARGRVRERSSMEQRAWRRAGGQEAQSGTNRGLLAVDLVAPSFRMLATGSQELGRATGVAEQASRLAPNVPSKSFRRVPRKIPAGAAASVWRLGEKAGVVAWMLGMV
jgi:hypothetical protein